MANVGLSITTKSLIRKLEATRGDMDPQTVVDTENKIRQALQILAARVYLGKPLGAISYVLVTGETEQAVTLRVTPTRDVLLQVTPAILELEDPALHALVVRELLSGIYGHLWNLGGITGSNVRNKYKEVLNRAKDMVANDAAIRMITDKEATAANADVQSIQDALESHAKSESTTGLYEEYTKACTTLNREAHTYADLVNDAQLLLNELAAVKDLLPDPPQGGEGNSDANGEDNPNGQSSGGGPGNGGGDGGGQGGSGGGGGNDSGNDGQDDDGSGDGEGNGDGDDQDDDGSDEGEGDGDGDDQDDSDGNGGEDDSLRDDSPSESLARDVLSDWADEANKSNESKASRDLERVLGDLAKNDKISNQFGSSAADYARAQTEKTAQSFFRHIVASWIAGVDQPDEAMEYNPIVLFEPELKDRLFPEGDEQRSTLVVAIDTSGSMTTEFLDWIAKLVGEDPTMDIRYLYFDAECTQFEAGDTMGGGGGTNFASVESWIQRNMNTDPYLKGRYPDGVLMYTDAYAPPIQPEHRDRWFWLVTPGGSDWPTQDEYGFKSYMMSDADLKGMN